ncbi:hypothetical protein OC834_001583 [Tilletia horrida]|nr:hypothetical protein OC834_001583 [Tilletia horrida]
MQHLNVSRPTSTTSSPPSLLPSILNPISGSAPSSPLPKSSTPSSTTTLKEAPLHPSPTPTPNPIPTPTPNPSPAQPRIENGSLAGAAGGGAGGAAGSKGGGAGGAGGAGASAGAPVTVDKTAAMLGVAIGLALLGLVLVVGLLVWAVRLGRSRGLSWAQGRGELELEHEQEGHDSAAGAGMRERERFKRLFSPARETGVEGGGWRGRGRGVGRERGTAYTGAGASTSTDVSSEDPNPPEQLMARRIGTAAGAAADGRRRRRFAHFGSRQSQSHSPGPHRMEIESSDDNDDDRIDPAHGGIGVSPAWTLINPSSTSTSFGPAGGTEHGGASTPYGAATSPASVYGPPLSHPPSPFVMPWLHYHAHGHGGATGGLPAAPSSTSSFHSGSFGPTTDRSYFSLGPGLAPIPSSGGGGAMPAASASRAASVRLGMPGTTLDQPALALPPQLQPGQAQAQGQASAQAQLADPGLARMSIAISKSSASDTICSPATLVGGGGGSRSGSIAGGGGGGNSPLSPISAEKKKLMLVGEDGVEKGSVDTTTDGPRPQVEQSAGEVGKGEDGRGSGSVRSSGSPIIDTDPIVEPAAHLTQEPVQAQVASPPPARMTSSPAPAPPPQLLDHPYLHSLQQHEAATQAAAASFGMVVRRPASSLGFHPHSRASLRTSRPPPVRMSSLHTHAEAVSEGVGASANLGREEVEGPPPLISAHSEHGHGHGHGHGDPHADWYAYTHGGYAACGFCGGGGGNSGGGGGTPGGRPLSWDGQMHPAPAPATVHQLYRSGSAHHHHHHQPPMFWYGQHWS